MTFDITGIYNSHVIELSRIRVLTYLYTCGMILVDPGRTPLRMFWLCSAVLVVSIQVLRMAGATVLFRWRLYWRLKDDKILYKIANKCKFIKFFESTEMIFFLQIWLSWTWTWIRIQKNCWIRIRIK